MHLIIAQRLFGMQYILKYSSCEHARRPLLVSVFGHIFWLSIVSVTMGAWHVFGQIGSFIRELLPKEGRSMHDWFVKGAPQSVTPPEPKVKTTPFRVIVDSIGYVQVRYRAICLSIQGIFLSLSLQGIVLSLLTGLSKHDWFVKGAPQFYVSPAAMIYKTLLRVVVDSISYVQVRYRAICLSLHGGVLALLPGGDGPRKLTDADRESTSCRSTEERNDDTTIGYIDLLKTMITTSALLLLCIVVGSAMVVNTLALVSTILRALVQLLVSFLGYLMMIHSLFPLCALLKKKNDDDVSSSSASIGDNLGKESLHSENEPAAVDAVGSPPPARHKLRRSTRIASRTVKPDPPLVTILSP